MMTILIIVFSLWITLTLTDEFLRLQEADYETTGRNTIVELEVIQGGRR